MAYCDSQTLWDRYHQQHCIIVENWGSRRFFNLRRHHILLCRRVRADFMAVNLVWMDSEWAHTWGLILYVALLRCLVILSLNLLSKVWWDNEAWVRGLEPHLICTSTSAPWCFEPRLIACPSLITAISALESQYWACVSWVLRDGRGDRGIPLQG